MSKLALMPARPMPARSKRPSSAFAIAVAMLLAACSGPASKPPDASALLRESASAMASVHSLTAEIRFGPGLVYEGFTLSSAHTEVSLPASSDTTLKVKQQDFLVDVRVVAVNGQVYVKVPFGKFTQVPADQAAEVPDLSRLFDSKHGLPALMAAGSSPRHLGSEKVDSTDCEKVATTYTADQVAQLLGGTRPAGDVEAILWIGKSDHRLYRVLLTGPLLQAGQSTTVDVTIRDYDKPITIVQPTP